MPAVLTELNQMVARTVHKVATDYTNSLVISFTDGCYIVLEHQHSRDSEDGIQAVSPDPTVEGLLVEAGVWTQEEYDQARRARDQSHNEQARSHRYQDYLRLQKEFGGG